MYIRANSLNIAEYETEKKLNHFFVQHSLSIKFKILKIHENQFWLNTNLDIFKKSYNWRINNIPRFCKVYQGSSINRNTLLKQNI